MELIQDVVVKQLKIIPDDRGYLMEMMRKDWPEFMEFAQSYVTACYPSIYKAWHYHKKQYDHFVCISGMSKVVLYDPRPVSPTRGMVNVFHMGQLNPILLRIPLLIYHGFTAEGGQPALIVNYPTELKIIPSRMSTACRTTTRPYPTTGRINTVESAGDRRRRDAGQRFSV